MAADDPSPEEGEEYEERQSQHGMAKVVAERFGLPSYFEEHTEDGYMFLDGYVYAPPERAVEMLKALKDAGVEVDIIDVEVRDPRARKRLTKELNEVDWARQVG